jgi:prepilin signal peptidase PulO-like enzyme (type II secretory pathway)
MIQRVQTIYLLLVAVFSALTSFFNLAIYTLNDELLFSYSIYAITPADGSEALQPGNWLPQTLLLTIVVLLSIFTISKYKNRKLQLKIGAINYLLLAAFIISSYFSIMNMSELLEMGDEVKTIYHIGFYLPIVAVSFQFLANRGIKKDEELVKSVDRLR